MQLFCNSLTPSERKISTSTSPLENEIMFNQRALHERFHSNVRGWHLQRWASAELLRNCVNINLFLSHIRDLSRKWHHHGKDKQRYVLSLVWFFVKEWANYAKIRQCYSMYIWITLLNRPNEMLKKLCFEVRTVTKMNPEQDFFNFMSKRRKYADVLPILAQNKSILHMACT